MRVLVAGGGIAALEALCGLRDLARDRVELTLLAPDREFSYRPLSTAVPFTFRDKRTRALEDLADGLGATFVRDGLVQVDTDRGRVLTHDGDFLPYDVLLVATGARTEQTGSGLAGRPDDRSAPVKALLREVEEPQIGSLALVVPPRAAWPLEAYELALVVARSAALSGSRVRVSLITAEDAPLERVGPAAGQAVADELERAQVELLTGTATKAPAAGQEAGRDAFSGVIARITRGRTTRSHDQLTLDLDPGGRIVVDRAMFLPSVHGPGVAGLSHDDNGFVVVDEHARVRDVPNVFAAGDATALPVKHSTLASRQATAAAQAIAAAAGAAIEPEPWSPVLYGVLALPPHFPGPGGSPWLPSGEPAVNCVWWPPGHVAGRHLAPYLASADKAVRPDLDWHPAGLPIAAPLAQDAATGAGAHPSEAAIRHDAIARQVIAARRTGREGERLIHALAQRAEEFDLHEKEVVAELRAAGYLREP